LEPIKQGSFKDHYAVLLITSQALIF